jgi:hypothetical protein
MSLHDTHALPPDWHSRASCANHPDPELWWYRSHKHPDENELQVLRMIEALEICNSCPVRTMCLQQGLEDENLHGGSIWGGLMNYERRMMLKKKSQNSFREEGYLVKRVRKKVARVS